MRQFMLPLLTIASLPTHGFVIVFSKFSPGLSPQEMKRDVNLSADCK
jgi:hypothetical protein